MKISNSELHNTNLFSRWSTAYCLLLTAYFLFPFQTTAQTITKAEYFFDADPGNGNGTPIAITPSGTVSFTTSIPTSSLSQGFHFLGIRVKETGGVWSIFEGRGFYITASTADVANISKAEYFIDSDPGNGNGTAIPISTGANVNFVVSVPTTSLSSGFHFLAIRTKDLSGKWGVFEARGFYITTSTTDVPNMTKAEYFFDADPGSGLATPIPVTAGATTNFTVSLPTTGLQPGFHFLAIRTKGADGKWGIFESRGFYVTSSTTDVPNITKAEYFFDADPGNGNGISIPITAGATSNFTATIPVTGLTPGFHFLAIRTKGADGKWGIFESRGFYVSPILPTTGDIVAAEYFVDTDPGEDKGIAIAVSPTGPTINQIFPIAIIGITGGPHKLGMRVKDADGIWSAVQMENFDVLVCTPPTAPTAPTASRCNSGTVTLTATSGATGSQVYKWYADAATTTVSFTGASFTTPSISISANFFVSVFDPITLCESNRTSVTAGVISTSPPILNVTGSVTICQGNAITLIAPAGFSNYLWSTGETTQTISVNTSGNFTAQVGNSTCMSLPSAAANITVVARPTKPTVAVTGRPLCAGQSITLKGPNGFTYLWSNGATTQQISPTLAGSYSVTVTDANGCTSLTSDAIVINAPPIKPAVFVVGGTTLCQGQTSTLIVPTGFASYAWSTGASTQQLTASAAGSYTVRVTDAGGCVSPLSDPVTIAINPAPAKPIITVAGSTTLCTGQSVSLNGPAGFNYVWSTGATSQQISVSQTGSYSLVVRDALGCTSALSDPLVVTVNPCGTSTRPPAIQQKTFTVPINNSITINISDLFTDPDNDLNLATLKIFESPASGAKVSIDANATLTIDYKGVSFGSAESFTLEVCDQANNCTRQQFHVIVAGEVIVYNAISPNGDPLNEVLYLEYITDLDATKNNVVSIFNRWGDKVFEAEDYNNATIAFKGIGTNGETLPVGTYFYQIEFKGGIPVKTGFFSLRR
jgi:gliding motility-associated-like protein